MCAGISGNGIWVVILMAVKPVPLSQGFDYNIAGDRAGSPYSYFYPYCRKQKCHLGLDEGSEEST